MSNNNEKAAIPFGTIKVEGIDYQDIIDIEIFESAHNHGVCTLKLILKKDFKIETLINLDKQKITLKADKDIIFCGVIVECSLEDDFEVKILNVRALTLSCLFDIEKRTRTFQSAKKKFSDVLNEIAKPYKPAEVTPFKDDTIAKLIYQHQKTDWQFLKEIAERHGQIIFADSKTDKTRLSVGFKSFKESDIDKDLKPLRKRIPMLFFKKLEANTYEGARSCYFLDMDFIVNDLNIGAGHSVKYGSEKQAVIASHIYVIGDILRNEITLRHEEGCRADAFDVLDQFQKFYYLTGKVLESKDTNVKVQFDCDEKQSKDEALDIPYESPASNYLYTMPDEGEKLCVYIDNIRQSAITSLRQKDVSDPADKKSFKIKDASLDFNTEKLEFAAAKDKAMLTEDEAIKITAKKDLIFSSKGDMIIQSAAGMLPDNQLTMTAAHMAGYAQYLATLGQPATVQFNPAGSTVGKLDSQIKNSGAKKESLELSDIAKELDKKTNRQAKSEQSKGGGGSGGSVKFDGKKGLVLQVKDSSIGMKDKNLNVKTRALIQVGYIPMAGGGTGSLSKFEGGSPNNRSDKINLEHGSEDRSRIKEEVTPVDDNKSISR